LLAMTHRHRQRSTSVTTYAQADTKRTKEKNTYSNKQFAMLVGNRSAASEQ